MISPTPTSPASHSRRRLHSLLATAGLAIASLALSADSTTNTPPPTSSAQSTHASTNLPPASTNAPPSQELSSRSSSSDSDSDSNSNSGSSSRSRRRRSDSRSDSRSDAPSNSHSSSSSTNAPPDPFSLDSFKLIADRNIFNPNRSPRRSRDRDRDTDAPPPKPQKTDSLSLLGILTYDSKEIAFFDGSESSYRKSVKRSDSIGGLTLKTMDFHSVKLEANGKTYELRVGSRLERRGDDPWTVIEGSPLATSNSSSSSSSSSNSSPASSTDAGGDEVLLRLLKKRQEEENK